MSDAFSTVTSADGTVIAYERHGRGPAVVFVDGALSVRGGKAGLDATNKWPPETTREWGRRIAMDPAVVAKVDAKWGNLGLGNLPRH